MSLRRTILLPMLLLAGGCTAFPFSSPDGSPNVKKETVVTGERERVSSHARWTRDGEKCIARTAPVLELKKPARHGKVEFAAHDRTPSGCDAIVPQSLVFYTSEQDYTGSDSFRYLRVNPDSGKKRTITVEIKVRAPKAKSGS